MHICGRFDKKSHSNTTEYFKKYIFYAPLMKMVILRTHKRTKSNSFPDALFRTLSITIFSKLATKSTKPIMVLSP
jgi:hypothetical protein